MLSEKRWVAHQADVLASAIVGTRVASDWSHSLKSGYDLLALEWPVRALDALGIDPDQLPSVGAGAITAALPSIDLAGASSRLSGLGHRLSSIPTSYPLAGTGERFPVIRPDAHGFVAVDGIDYSLSAAATLLDPDLLLASIMLGIACVERLSLEMMARAGAAVDGTLSSSGGGTNNEWWT